MLYQICIFILLMFVNPLFAATNSCDSKVTEGCKYYSCLNKEKKCAANNYLMKFGYHYCNKFVANASHFSSKGKIWLEKVRSCLQRKLVFEDQLRSENEYPPLACDRIESFAYASHVPCYVSTGFCKLRNRDRRALFEIVHPELIDIKTHYLFSQIVLECSIKKGTELLPFSEGLLPLPQGSNLRPLIPPAWTEDFLYYTDIL